MSDRTRAIEFVGVRKYYDQGRVHALDGLDLVIDTGEWVAVTGPSGCGKSTMLHLAGALDAPSSGTVRVDGTDLSHLRDPAAFRREHIGLVFQLHYLLPQLSASQNIEVAMLGTSRTRRERVERAHELLAQMDLAGRERRKPSTLSGGERQRVAIARALANEPPLLLADEPTGSLDEAAVGRVLDLFRSLRAERPELTIVLVTHDPAVAAQADRVVHLRAGRVEEPPQPSRGVASSAGR
jgi:putative ABC transport system ATP-binding protein